MSPHATFVYGMFSRKNCKFFLTFVCPVVNFINVKRANFTYESLFSNYALALIELSYKKCWRKTLIKLTPYLSPLFSQTFILTIHYEMKYFPDALKAKSFYFDKIMWQGWQWSFYSCCIISADIFSSIWQPHLKHVFSISRN